MLNRWQAPMGCSLRKVHPRNMCLEEVQYCSTSSTLNRCDASDFRRLRFAPPTVKHSLLSSMACHPHVNHNLKRWGCNRAAVVYGGDVRVSPHSRLRRQCGVIEVVTAPRLISPPHLLGAEMICNSHPIRMQEGGVTATRGCASLTPGYKPRLRLGLTCFACHLNNIVVGVLTITMR